MLRGGTVAATGKLANYSSRVTRNNVLIKDTLLLGLPQLYLAASRVKPPLAKGNHFSLGRRDKASGSKCPSLLLSPHSHPLLLSALGSPGLISLCPKHIYSSQEAQAATHSYPCFNPLIALCISYSGPTAKPSPTLWGALHNPSWSSTEPLRLKSLF